MFVLLGRNKKMYKLKNEDPEIIREFIPTYDEKNIVFPTVACNTCIQYLKNWIRRECETSKANLTKRVQLKPHVTYTNLNLTVSLEDTCKCFFCEYKCGKAFLPPKLKRKRDEEPNKEPSIKTVCSQCLSPVKHTRKHKCNNYLLINNIIQLAEEKEILDRLTVSILRRKSSNGHRNRQILLNVGAKNETSIIYSPKKQVMEKEELIKLHKLVATSKGKRNACLKLIRKCYGRRSVSQNIEQAIESEVVKLAELMASKVFTLSVSVTAFFKSL